jgi:hypothetical protein
MKAEFLQQNDSVLITVIEKMTSTDTGLLDSRRCENHLLQVAQQRRIFFFQFFPVVRSHDLTWTNNQNDVNSKIIFFFQMISV